MKFCVYSVFASDARGSIPFYLDGNREGDNPTQSHTLFLRLPFLLCVESRDEIYFIFDFRVSLDADIELTSSKVNEKKNHLNPNPNRMRDGRPGPLRCQTRFCEYKLGDQPHATKRNNNFELATHE